MPTDRPLTRGDTLAGIAFIVFFLGGVVSSSPPDASASDAKWIANYTGSSNNWGHLISGVFLILAALSLATFMTGMWRRISSARPAGMTSPLPLVLAGIASTLMAFGGMLMAYIAGSELSNKYPLPSADLLRFSNGFGFIVTGVPGMAATAFCIAVLTGQARSAGVFGTKLAVFSWLVAAVLLLSFLFLPIAALFAWIVACLVASHRNAPAHAAGAPDRGTTPQPSNLVTG